MLQPHNPSKRMRAPTKTGPGPSVRDLADVTVTEVPGPPEDKPPPGRGRPSGRTRIINVVEDSNPEGGVAE
jgi:hypothetical protein